MPVRSLDSSVRKWPGRAEVFETFRAWARRQTEQRPAIERISCFGSLVNGTWGVGSDIDILIILNDSTTHPLRRAAQGDTTGLPVPADVVVLTQREAEETASVRFRDVIEKEVVWVEKHREEAD